MASHTESPRDIMAAVMALVTALVTAREERDTSRSRYRWRPGEWRYVEPPVVPPNALELSRSHIANRNLQNLMTAVGGAYHGHVGRVCAETIAAHVSRILGPRA